jgi:hypothetical protein
MKAERRSAGVTALAVFFGAGSAIALVAAASLFTPGGFLEPIWRLNPRARTAFSGLGLLAPLLLLAVSGACLAASVGVARRRAWGRALAIALIAINLVGDSANAILGVDRRAAVGIPIAAALLVYLFSSRVREELGGQAGRGGRTRPAA